MLRIPLIKKIVIPLNNAQRIIDREGAKAKLKKEDMYDNMLSMMEHGVLKLLDEDSVIESLRSIQYEYVMKNDEPTRLRIYGTYAHIVEGLMRAAWLANQKHLNIAVHWV